MEYGFEPAAMEVLLTEIVGNTLMRGYYKGFAASIGLAGGERVLDWCAGSGMISKRLAAGLPGGHLVFADVSAKWLARASRRLRRCANAEGCRIDGFDGPVAGGSFDRIVVHYSLHDFPAGYRMAIVRQLAASLKPGGILMLREPVGRAGSHGIRLCDLFNLLEAEKSLRYEYEIRKHRLAGEYVEVTSRTML